MHKTLLAAAFVAFPLFASPQPTIRPYEQCKMPSAADKLEKKGLRCPAAIVKVAGSNAYCVAGTKGCDDPKGMEFIERLKGECQEKTGMPCPLAVEIDPAHNRYRTLCGPALPEASGEPMQEK